MSDTRSPYDDDDADPYAADDTKSPHEEVGEPAADGAVPSPDDDAPAPRRKPGRPRKNP